MKTRFLILSCLLCSLIFLPPVFSQSDPLKLLEQHCRTQFADKQECPEHICQLQVRTDAKGADQSRCVPISCPKIPSEHCPEEFCSLMTDCSDKEICHYKMYGEPAICGDTAYAGQNVECCPGLIRRCGIEFYDGSCDMEGKNSVYNLPICIPCGDGICTNFENRCNCPEDCGTPPDIEIIPLRNSLSR